ncbi:MAG: DUF5688 family protein [Lachnospiraceae bacterium]|nr:DUF5688 family protein [Lachnospiraceae bacterium]
MERIQSKEGFEIFTEKIRAAMEQHYGESFTVEIKDVMKNNGVIITGLAVKDNSRSACPTVYLESFYEQYEDGRSMSSIVEELVEVFEKNDILEPEELAFFTDYEQVKPKLSIKLINRAYNSKLLEDVPYRDFLDMAIVCLVEIDVKDKVTGSILVRNNHICMWGVKADRILDDAIAQFRLNKNITITDIADVVDEIHRSMFTGGDIPDEYYSRDMMYVVSTGQQTFGAAVLALPETVGIIAAKVKTDYYVIPSSIHELIVLPCRYGDDREALDEMIKSVNASMLKKEEILSDHAYRYIVRKEAICW